MALQIINGQKKLKTDLRRFRRSVRLILKALDCTDRELNIFLTDDAGIQVLNRDYLGKDKPTNVISFAMTEGDIHIAGEDAILGDVIISLETARRDAEKGGLSLEQELDFLMIHGILHLIGYDHIGSRSEARKMSIRQKALFETLHGFRIA